MKQFVLGNNLQPQVAAGLRPLFEGTQHHFVQNKVNDNRRQKNNAEDNNE